MVHNQLYHFAVLEQRSDLVISIEMIVSNELSDSLLPFKCRTSRYNFHAIEIFASTARSVFSRFSAIVIAPDKDRLSIDFHGDTRLVSHSGNYMHVAGKLRLKARFYRRDSHKSTMPKPPAVFRIARGFFAQVVP